MNPTADTAQYLVLGIAAVFIPLLLYVLTLLLRIRNAQRRLSGTSPLDPPGKGQKENPD